MDFVFQGFQSSLPAWVYVILLLGSIGLSWWSYTNLQSAPFPLKLLLISLRSAVFVLLLVLLLNPFFKAESTYLENPEVLVFLDNSESVGLSTGDYKGSASYRRVLETLNLADSSQVNYSLYRFGGRVYETRTGSLSFSDDRTNLYDPIRVIRDNEREISGSIIISDGIFNTNRNPVFEADAINKPIFTIGLGDTTSQKDLVVQSIETNATGYVDTDHPVQVTIKNNGFAGISYGVEIEYDGEVLASRQISPETENSVQTVNFTIPLHEEGLNQYSVRVPELEGEWTAANNRQPFTVDVIDQKQHILSLAFEIHPDVRALRSLLLADANTRLSQRTWLGGQRFLEGNLSFSADSLDLIILQGFPNSGLNAELTNRLSDIIDQVPAVVMATPQANFESFAASFNYSLPVIAQATADLDEVGLAESLSSTQHPILEVPEVSYAGLPSIYAPVRGLQLSRGAESLFESTFMGKSTEQPLLAIQELGNTRTAYISGFGWYRIFQSSSRQQREFIAKLFKNIVSWTATRPDNRRLRLEPAKKTFTGFERVVLNATLKNESGLMESNGTVDIRLTGEHIDERFYTMENVGSGEYELELGSLPEGLYRFSGTAQKGNRRIDVRKGEFSVTKSNTEYISITRNEQLLKQLSANTGGHYFSYDNLSGFRDSLNKKGMLSKKEKVSETLFFPYQHSFWFIIVVALLGAEWIIRKYLALP